VEHALQPDAFEDSHRQQQANQRFQRLVQIMTGEQPDQSGRGYVLHQEHIRLQTLEYVDPAKLGSSGSHPQHNASRENYLGCGPCKKVVYL